jgi:hypothetical protein
MATARELLAQADALMRRNRLREAVRTTPPEESADFPVLTEAVGIETRPSPEPSQIDIEQAIDVAELETEAAVAAATDAALAREAAANGIAAPCAPVADDEADNLPGDMMVAVEGPEATSAVAPLAQHTFERADADVVIPADALSFAPATTAVVARGADLDDFPVLTEVVDASLDADTPAEMGERVTWAEFDADIVARDATPVESNVARVDTLAAVEPLAPVSDAKIVETPPAPFIENAATDEPSAMVEVIELSPADAALVEASLPEPVNFDAVAEPIEASVAGALPEAPAVAIAAPATAAALVAADAARWNALAEEIRMQVLQRIDIFTDTGLQEQLAARLQPIVDRASADLVATINQQIGALLRAYVAEAIEREIDRWREDAG